MRYTRFFLLLLLVPLFSMKPGKSLQEVTIHFVSYCDHFDQCGSGKTRMERALYLTSGVKSVKVDSKEKTVTVKYRPNLTSPEKLREVISKAGYDADDVKADPAGYGELDDCCKKKE